MEKTPAAHVFWVYGGTSARFHQGYKRIARDLSLPSWDDPDTNTLELVLDWFSKTDQPFLLVLDNADNMADYWPRKISASNEQKGQYSDLSAYLPEINSKGFLLITSRDSRIGGRLMRKGKPISMESMSLEEARRLFLSKADDHKEQCGDTDLDKLLRGLDYLPLAITQAAAFISENRICVPQYLSALEGDDAHEYLEEELNDSRRDEESVNSVLRTWKLSFDQITAQKPRAAELLFLMAMFDRQSIPKTLLRLPEVITSLGTLQSFNLISSRTDTNSFQMHRLVQRFVQFFLQKSETIEQWQEAAVTAVSKAYPSHVGVSDWSVCENLAPHVQTVLTYQVTSVTARLSRGHLLCWAADYDVERGLYDRAFHRAVESDNLIKHLVPATDQRLAASQWQFGRLQYYQSRSESQMNIAAAALTRALSIAVKPSIIYADISFELAHLYYERNDTQESLEMAEACWTSYKALWGPTDVRVLDHMHDHALKLAMFGQEEAGIKMWQEVLALCDASNASKDTKLVFTIRSMAGIAEFREDSRMAEILYKQLITHCENLLGPDHVHIFDYRLSHAEQVMRQGRLDDARELSQSILASSENKHEWRIIVSCFEMIAEICNRKTLYAEAEDHRVKCLDTYKEMLGADNNEAIDAMDGLAKALTLNRKYDKAQPLYSSIFEWREQHLGATHPDTLEALEKVGIAMMHQADDHNAELNFSEVLCRTTEPSLRTYSNLCATLWHQGKWKRLEVQSRHALDLDGAESPFKAYLIVALERQGHVEEALALRASNLDFESAECFLGSRRQPEEPIVRETKDRRFGRIIHPRVYSS